MKKIIFFKTGGFSKVNTLLQERFPKVFPGYDVEFVDVLEDILERRPLYRASLLCRSLLRYRRNIFSNWQNPKDFFVRFDDSWSMILEWVRGNVHPRDVAFTFQTQSLFDASHPDIPHFIYTDHTYLAYRRYPNPRQPAFVTPRWKELERELYRHAKVNFTTSEFCATSIVEDYGVPTSSVECVYSGINVAGPSHSSAVAKSGRCILFAGVDWVRKGGPVLIESFREIRRQLPDSELWIAGCDPGITEAGVRNFGRVDTEKMQELYSKADVFCLPSKYEPSAAVIAEASYYELPVVATKVGGSVERVIENKTGFLVPPDDAASLTSALMKILTQPELASSFGHEGKKLAEERFSWEIALQKMQARILQELQGEAHA